MTDLDERLMQELVCGDRAESDPQVQALFARDPQSEARYRRMMQLTGRLDEIGAESELAGEAVAEEDGPSELLRPTAGRRLGLAVLAAAALVVLAVVVVRPDPPGPGDVTPVAKDSQLPVAGAETKLGSTKTAFGTLTVQRTAEGVAIERVQWEWNEPPRAGWYTVVTVWGGADHSVPLVRADADEEDSEWVAGSKDLAAMAASAPTRVTVHVVRADGRRAEAEMSTDF